MAYIFIFIFIEQIIFRTLLVYLERSGKKSLRNLYVQLDNTAINKSFVLVGLMGALSLLGITRKVKVSYLKVGHSHTLGDGVIGVVGTQVVNGNMPTFESFRTAVKSALRKEGHGFVEVYRLIGITDYKVMFDDICRNPNSISGM